MKTVFFVWLMLFSAGVMSASAPVLDDGLVNPGHEEKPAWFKDSFLDIREDIAEAKASGKQLLLYFYQDGCPYCTKLLKTNFTDPVIVEKTQAGFDVIAINMWGDRGVTDGQGEETTEKAFAKALKVQYTPTLLFMDGDGQVALRVNGYYAPPKFVAALDYVAGQHAKDGSFRDYYAKRLAGESAVTEAKPMPVIADGLPQPLRLADARKDSGRALLVIFEQAGCDACEELHRDVLARPEVAYSLSNLDVAQVDMASSAKMQAPDGQEMGSADWVKSLDIKYTPSLVFFDADGQEVFRTEAYLKAFHLHGAMDYVVSGAYRWQPEFQRFLQHRTEVMRARGFSVELMQ